MRAVKSSPYHGTIPHPPNSRNPGAGGTAPSTSVGRPVYTLHRMWAVFILGCLTLAAGDSTPITVLNMHYDDDFFRFSFGDPGHCVGEWPLCGDVGAIKRGVAQTFTLNAGANYLSVGGGVKTAKDGSVCHTWLSDDSFCAVYPGSTEGDCSRLSGANCTKLAASPIKYALEVTVDRDCDTLPYEDCTATSRCCGAANKCVRYDPKVNETKCWPK